MTDIGIIAVGGYNEMGRNMTAIRVDEDIIIVDMGLRLDRVQIHEDVEIDKMHSLELIEMGAIPDDTIMKQVNGNVAAIVCTHGHLDHIGAIPKLAHRYTAPIIGTPYTAALIKQQIESERKFGVKNKIIPVEAGGTYQINDDVSIELIRIQPSLFCKLCRIIGIFIPYSRLIISPCYRPTSRSKSPIYGLFGSYLN